MKTIGLLGGMSWESTVLYYQTINRIVGARLGGFHSAKILLASVDFHEIEQLQQDGHWHRAGEILADTARKLEGAGAEILVLCTNTMHKVAPQLEAAASIPLLHIADATATAIAKARVNHVGLLGTRFTMEEDFYRGRLEAAGLEVSIPPEADRAIIHRVIYEELCRGQILAPSRARFQRIVADLVTRGCRGVILGCTEIGLLLGPDDAPVPLFDTAAIHAERAASLSLEPAASRHDSA